MSEQPDHFRAHKAQPERFRFTFWDDPAADSTPLEMPARQNMWPLGIVFAVFFAIFAGVLWMMIAKLLLALKTPAPALVLLILLKIAVDLRAHRRERATKTGKPATNSGNGGK